MIASVPCQPIETRRKKVYKSLLEIFFIKMNFKGDPSQYQPAPATPTTEAANSQSGAPQFFNPTQFGANPPAMPTS